MSYLSDQVTLIYDVLLEVRDGLNNVSSRLQQSGDHLKVNEVYDAGVDLKWAGLAIAEVAFDMGNTTLGFRRYIRNALLWIDGELGEAPPEYELTLDDILSVMLQATPDQVMYFIGLVDAYRLSVWNREFNEEYYAALARGFMEWE